MWLIPLLLKNSLTRAVQPKTGYSNRIASVIVKKTSVSYTAMAMHVMEMGVEMLGAANFLGAQTCRASIANGIVMDADVKIHKMINAILIALLS